MKAWLLGAKRADEAARVVRALGAHRYVAGRAHFVHAFVFTAAGEGAAALGEGLAWSRTVLEDRRVDPASRDETLWRRASDAEVAAVIEAFWSTGPEARAARTRLDTLLRSIGWEAGGRPAFDDAAEDEMHPLLVDAGWELLPLSELDPERHRGVIGAFGDPLAFASACFEAETAIPPVVHLYELPALGPTELLHGVDDGGLLQEPLVVWAEGHEVYVDYVLRGVRRAAKLPEEIE